VATEERIMSLPPDVEYTVVLVTPGYGEARENATEVVEAALDHLNTYRDEPGFRFAPYVTAHLEVVSDLDEAGARLDDDDSLAMFILHDVDEDERLPFIRRCERKSVRTCYTSPADELEERQRHALPREFQLVLRPRSKDDGPPAHHILDTVLTDPLEGDEEQVSARVWQLIAVMALGVMEHHWRKNPPRHLLP
jgi:hypothetical protein